MLARCPFYFICTLMSVRDVSSRFRQNSWLSSQAGLSVGTKAQSRIRVRTPSTELCDLPLKPASWAPHSRPKSEHVSLGNLSPSVSPIEAVPCQRSAHVRIWWLSLQTTRGAASPRPACWALFCLREWSVGRSVSQDSVCGRYAFQRPP